MLLNKKEIKDHKSVIIHRLINNYKQIWISMYCDILSYYGHVNISLWNIDSSLIYDNNIK
jgi:hypothetical protein